MEAESRSQRVGALACLHVTTRRRIICVGGLWAAGKSTIITELCAAAGDRVTAMDVKQLPAAPARFKPTLRVTDLTARDLRSYYSDLAYVWNDILIPRARKENRHIIVETSPLVLTWLRRNCTHSVLLDTPAAVCAARLAARNELSERNAGHLIAIQERACRLSRMRRSMRYRIVTTQAALWTYLSELVTA